MITPCVWYSQKFNKILVGALICWDGIDDDGYLYFNCESMGKVVLIGAF